MARKSAWQILMKILFDLKTFLVVVVVVVAGSEGVCVLLLLMYLLHFV